MINSLHLNAQASPLGKEIDELHESVHDESVHDHVHSSLTLRMKESRLLALLLEIGIAAHSVIIGLDLGLSSDQEFKVITI